MKKKTALILLSLIIALSYFSCSAVFTASVTGIVADEEDWDEDPENAGIGNVVVLLYDTPEKRQIDSDLFAESAELDPTDSLDQYLQKTVTDDDGTFEINGVIWENKEPVFGKDGDIKTVYLLVYHKNYGLVEKEARLVSDVTNRNLLIKIPKMMNIIPELTGRLINEEDGNGIEGINVTVYIPRSWEYSGNEPVNFIWEYDHSSYQLNEQTDENGDFSFANVSYPMEPDTNDNKGTVRFKLEFSANDYFFDTSVDSHLTKDSGDDPSTAAADDPTDFDSDGTADPYYFTGIFSEGKRQNLAYDIKARNNENRCTIQGKIVNSVDREEVVAEADVSIYIAKSWTYSSDDTDGTHFENIEWSDEASYTAVSDEEGIFTFDTVYDMLPSAEKNKGTAPARLFVEKNGYDTRWTYSSADDAITDDDNDNQDGYFQQKVTDVDHDGDSSTNPVSWTLSDGNFYASSSFSDINADNENDVYISLILRNDTNIRLDQNDKDYIGIKQSSFTASLTGRVALDADDDGIVDSDSDSSDDGYKNNKEVWLFLNKTEVSDTALDTISPDDSVTTRSEQIDDSKYESGHFEFSNINWTDTHYTGNYSQIKVVVYVPDSGDVSAGYVDGCSTGNGLVYTLKSGDGNSAEIFYQTN